jgi:hypothetical protein
MKYLLAPIMIALGILLMKYTVKVTFITGKIGFAEKYFQSFGGTYAWWRIVGLAMIVIGLAWLTGVISISRNPAFQLN